MNAPQITHSVTVVTPATATRWLGTNHNNRKVREARVLKYREDMESGRWSYAGDPIRFDTAGNLIDGQHRLLALSGAQVEGIAFLVIRGLPSEAQSVMDQGAKRTAGDQLGMFGIKNASNIASAVKQYLIWERGLLFRDQKVVATEISTPLIELWVRDNPERIELMQVSINDIRRTGGRPMVAGAAYLIFQEVDASDAAEFLNRLANGAGYAGDPINTLDQKLRRLSGRKTPVRDELALFVQAWNAWREGRTLSNLVRPRGGAWTPDNFPVAK